MALIIAVCSLVIGGLYYFLDARRLDTAEMLRFLPSQDAVVGYVDVAALRQTGLLHASVNSVAYEEPEYRSFVQETGFDYTQDLDALLISVDGRHRYFLVRGRFAWNRLRQYALHHKGSCYNGLCEMKGSTPERKISFYSPREGVLALAVSPAPKQALELRLHSGDATPDAPSGPVWASIPYELLKEATALPPGTHAFVSALDGAARVVLTVRPAGTGLKLRLAAQCSSPMEAEAVSQRLTKLTDTLKSWIEREAKRPNPQDLSGLLTSGAFSVSGTTALGVWPVPPALVQSLFESN